MALNCIEVQSTRNKKNKWKFALRKILYSTNAIASTFQLLKHLGFQGHTFCAIVCNQTCIVLEDLYPMSINQ